MRGGPKRSTGILPVSRMGVLAASKRSEDGSPMQRGLGKRGRI